MAVLNVLKGPNVGHRYPLEHDRTILGRHPDCQIVLEIGAISREHAAIERVNGDFFIEDLGSRNGTFVNGQPVDLAQPRKLLENDRVKICDMLLTFHRDARKIDSAALTTRPPIEMVSDDAGGSTILSTLEVRGKSSSTAPGVRPEVKLQALLEITRNLGATLGLDQVLPKILDSLFKIFVQADRGFIVLREPDGGALAPKAFRQRREDDDENVRISRTIVNKAMNDKEAILSHDAATDKRFDTSQSIADFRIRSMMCAPLVSSEGQALGVIQIDTMDQRTQFTQDDLDVLAAVACQAAVSVENAQLHGAALKRQALERDLTLAHTVQRGFLPSQPPKIAGYEFFDFYEPANQVGGDYFDYIPLPGNRLGVIAADVAGKGIAAALLMAKLSADSRYTLVRESAPAFAMSSLNATFTGAGWEDRFVTMAMFLIDFDKHVVTIANAGHMPPYLRRRDGSVEAVGQEKAGVPLGVAPDFHYEEFSLKLGSGDCLVVFTDGFSEAMNVAGELYGLERLQNQLKAKSGGVLALGEKILADVKRFAGKRAQSDDMCLICFGRV